MNGLLKLRRQMVLMVATIAGLLDVHHARCERAYLPSVGSPPLRIQAVTTNRLVFNLENFAQPPKPEEASNAVVQMVVPAANPTNLVENSSLISVSSETNQSAVKPETAADAKNNSVPPYNFTNPSSSASDLLTVTPQMITEYLKPVQTETNRTD